MVGSVTDANGIATEYTYSPAGLVTRIVRRDGADKYTYDYHVDGQLATATYGNTTEDFLWDGLALVKRGKRGFVNEPHVGGGNPVMSSDGTTYFNDMLGTTLSSSADGETTSSSLTAFGATSQLTTPNSQLTTPNSDSFFTGKPFVPGLGHAFLFRNYRSDLGKWQTADPLGYPDGWNQLAYCGNRVMDAVDLWGGKEYDIPFEMRDFYFDNACNMVGQNNPCLLEDISRRTRNAAANAAYPVVYQSLGPDIIYAYDDWTRTGRTRNENGYTEYEEEKWEYKYKYDVYLVLMNVSYGTDGWWRAVALGLGLGGIAAGGPVGWTIGVGGSALGIGDWLLSGTDYVPLGVVFELTSIEKVPYSRKTHWVE